MSSYLSDTQSLSQVLSPQSFVKQTLILIWHEFPMIIAGGLFATLFWAASMFTGLVFDQPFFVVATLPFLFFPVLTGVFYISGMVSRGYGIGFKDLFQKIIKCYGKSLSMGLLIVIPYLFLLGTWNIYTVNSQQKWLWVPMVLQGSIFIISIISSVYTFTLISFYKYGLPKLICYSWSLIAHSPIETAGILALLLLLIFLVWWTRFGMLPVAIGVWSLFTSQMNHMTIQKINPRINEV